MTRFSFNPLLAAAFGAALAYYAFAKVPYSAAALMAVLFLLAAAISLPVAALSLGGDRYRPRVLALFAVFFAGGFTLGFAAHCAAWRTTAVFPGLPLDGIIGISGVLLDDPRVSASGRGIAALRLSQSAGTGGVRASARGRTLVFFPEGAMPRLKEFGRGSTIFIDGKFVSGKNSADAKMFRAVSVHIIKPPSRIGQFRTKIRLAIVSLFSGVKWGGLALALLIGIRDNLDSEFSAQYFRSGCSYILALSGMHLAIISAIIAFLLKKPLGLKAAAAVGAVFIVLYIYLAGPQSSLVRSGIAYLTGTAMILLSLKTNAVQILGISFLVQLILDPASGATISFMLSYLALAGMLLIGNPFNTLLQGWLPERLSRPLSASLGAFISTLGICAVYFGDLRPIGVITGLAVIPLTTLFMTGALAYLAVFPVFPPLASLLDTGLSLIYTALDTVTKAGAFVPGVPVINLRLFVILSSIAPLVIVYLCMVKIKARTYIEKFD